MNITMKISTDNTQTENVGSEQPQLSQRPFLRFRQIIEKYFGEQKITETRKAIVLNDLVNASSPGNDFFIMILFSSAIATFGLIADLSVVTIGAQLIDPLMSPILGLAIASLSGLQRMFNRSFVAIVKGAGAAIGISALISFFTYRLPYSIHASIPHEVMVRTTASPFDLGIAIVGGAAAAYALAHPRLDAALPGVAIATALMPPLCTIGFGVAFQSTFIVLGAALQFFTNYAAITFAAIITFALLGFGPNKFKKDEDLSHSVLVSAIMVLIIAIPLMMLAWNSVSTARLDNRVSDVIMGNLPDSVQPQLVDLEINSVENKTDITVTLRMVRELTSPETLFLHTVLVDQMGTPVTMRVVILPMQIID